MDVNINWRRAKYKRQCQFLNMMKGMDNISNIRVDTRRESNYTHSNISGSKWSKGNG